MSAKLIDNAYGKAEVRLVQVDRRGSQHRLRDLTVETELIGEFAAAYRDGDNRAVLPTDTMKNTVYALAHRRKHQAAEGFEAIEHFGGALAERLLTACPAAAAATIDLTEHPWDSLSSRAFQQPGGATRRAMVEVSREEEVIEIHSGFDDLRVLKTTDSGFSDFLHDEFTTLEDAADRMLATEISALWLYDSLEVDYDAAYAAVKKAVLDCFADHHSLSVQQTLQLVAEAVFEARSEVAQIHLRMPNIHHLVIDLERLGLETGEGPADVFVATDAPFGVIQGTFARD